jgi:peptide/nickel transport system substrate-binding protein
MMSSHASTAFNLYRGLWLGVKKIMLKRRTVLMHSAAVTAWGAVSLMVSNGVLAQGKKDSIVLGMALEPPGLDPTAGAAAAIAEIVHYNILETLTKINSDGKVTPLLAESWEISPDLKTYTFKLRRGVKFQNGEPFNAQAVKFSFDRAGGDKSTNKDKRTFANLGVQVVDDHTVVLLNKEVDPDLPFLLGQATAVIVEPNSADTNATQPVGTGPYKLASWNKGASVVLTKWAGFRNPGLAKINKATFRFVSDPAAQAAALLSGDVDAFPRAATRIVAQFRNNPQFQVIVGGSRAKTILAINSKRKPLDDVRVRRAILAAIDRKAVIEGAADGFGTPIGSHYVPGAEGFVDTTSVNPFNVERAKQLLAEAGVKTPLELTMTLPPPSYARQGGEVIVSELAKIGISVKVQNVEWAQWLSNTYGGPHNYDLTIISHVEPFDLGNYAKPDYYWGYQSKAFNGLFDRIKNAGNEKERAKLLGDAQKLLAQDAANGFLYQPQFPTIAKKELKGLWKDMPIFVNDLTALSWM